MDQPALQSIETVDLRLIGRTWPFASAERQKIDAHWQSVIARAPASWNGSVLVTRQPVVADGVLHGEVVATDYAAFIAWSDWGWPDRSVFNLFGSAVIRSSDGALIFGVMGTHTLNPGQCYPPGGSLDPGDAMADGRIDIMGSIARELAEETGLDVADAKPAGLYAVFDGQRVSVARELQFQQPAHILAAQTRRHIAADEAAELTDVKIVRRAGDLPDQAPGYARALTQHLLG